MWKSTFSVERSMYSQLCFSDTIKCQHNCSCCVWERTISKDILNLFSEGQIIDFQWLGTITHDNTWVTIPSYKEDAAIKYWIHFFCTHDSKLQEQTKSFSKLRVKNILFMSIENRKCILLTGEYTQSTADNCFSHSASFSFVKFPELRHHSLRR